MFVIWIGWHQTLLENDLSLRVKAAMRYCSPTETMDGSKCSSGKCSSCCSAQHRKALSTCPNPAISPLSLSLSLSSQLLFDSESLLPSLALLFHFLLSLFNVSLFLCVFVTSPFFQWAYAQARMSSHNPNSLGAAVLARAAKSGIYIHATCPLTLARRNQGSETRSGFTLFPS